MKAVAAASALASIPMEAWESTEASDSADEPRSLETIAEDEAIPIPTFDEIYDQHLVFVWRSLRALGVPRPFLDDAVQDVFVVVHRRLFTFEGRSKVTTWLFGIAFRVARNYRRRQVPSDELSEVEGRIHDHRPSPFEETAQTETVQLVERILDSLDDKKRIVFVLMEIEQMTAEEVAALLGTNVHTVYSRRRVARIEFDRLVALHGKGVR